MNASVEILKTACTAYAIQHTLLSAVYYPAIPTTPISHSESLQKKTNRRKRAHCGFIRPACCISSNAVPFAIIHFDRQNFLDSCLHSSELQSFQT